MTAPESGPPSMKPLQWLRTLFRDPQFQEKEPTTRSLKLVAAALETFAKPNGADFFASRAQLAGPACLSETTVKRHLATLQNALYLYQVERGGRRGTRGTASTWRLTTPDQYSEWLIYDESSNGPSGRPAGKNDHGSPR